MSIERTNQKSPASIVSEEWGKVSLPKAVQRWRRLKELAAAAKAAATKTDVENFKNAKAGGGE